MAGEDAIVIPWPLLTMAQGVEPPQSDGEAAGEGLALRGRTILIVEDESLIALLLTDALEEAGASIAGPCYTLMECMKAAKAQGIDAAVLDVDLAGQDVFPAAEELRKRNIPFIFHTAHADRQELHARFGEVPVCRKPTRMEDLVSVLARMTGENRTN